MYRWLYLPPTPKENKVIAVVMTLFKAALTILDILATLICLINLVSKSQATPPRPDAPTDARNEPISPK